MKKTVKTRFRNREFVPFTKRKLLLIGIPGLFFPCSYENDYSAVFQTDGYVSISDAGKLTSCDVLDILEILLAKEDEAENYYFEKGSYLVSSDTVFVQYGEKHRISDVKLIYVPDIYGNDGEICWFSASLKQYTDMDGCAYLDNFHSFIENSKPTFVQIVKYIEQAKQEIHIFEKY